MVPFFERKVRCLGEGPCKNAGISFRKHVQYFITENREAWAWQRVRQPMTERKLTDKIRTFKMGWVCSAID